jgi:hypothetical protein
MADMFELGCRRVDLFFMIGIPEQTPESVMDTVRYCGHLLDRFGRGAGRGRLRPFISPLAPFLDPGSRAFEEPERHGYRLFHRTLEEHRKALLMPSWKYVLNYENQWMSRDELVTVTYEAAQELNRLKVQYGLLSEKEGDAISRRMLREADLMSAVDRVVAGGGDPEQDTALRDLIFDYRATHGATICKKDEMNWPTAFLRFRILPILGAIVTGGRTGGWPGSPTAGHGVGG